jgi:serine/threonine-protein kinase
MKQHAEDHPTWSAGPPPVMHSDRVYDYPADPPPRPPWLTPVAIVGACVAVIALVIAAVALVGRPMTSSTVTSTVAAPPTLVTQISTVTMPPLPPQTNTVVVPVPMPPPPQPQPQPQPVSACQQLRNQANADNPYTAAQATGYWVPQLSSKRPGLVADGITWDCDSILAEHMQLRATYTADLLWSGDWPHTYGHNDYWVTVAAYTFDTAEGARQWCVDHGRDVPEHCYPTQIR